ncbi:PepSY domain-containing protein [Streptomyces albus]|uniref:PepSY domain-containing protein n=1 Tax=Streptomyces sp. NRRL F-5917 TaxID=1463873 RepID=UPI0004BEBD5C|nr:PepSY domain-containing protein [Streptomyces sp. NRRL F-5917]
MKRKVIIATVTAAVLIGGGTATAFGVAGGDGDGGDRAGTASQTHLRPAEHDDDHADGQDRDDDGRDHDDDGKDDDGKDDGDRAEDTGAGALSHDRAARAVLKAVPGTVTELELDTERDRLVWEADVLGKDAKWHEVKIDAVKGGVVTNRVDGHKDDDRATVRAARIDAAEIGDKAAARTGGTVTSVSLEADRDDHDKGRWEAETVDKKGQEHELVLDGTSGKVLHHETEQDDD